MRNFLTGTSPLAMWLMAFVITGLVAVVFRSFFCARKIQPNGFRWRTFRNEAFFGVLNVATGGVVLGYVTTQLTQYGFITTNQSPASWWVTGLEFAAYFFAFDCYFYWFHRLMHLEPIYTWVHKIHHYSVSPNALTTLSVNPLESLVNGGFVPLFVALFTVHDSTMMLITPTNIIMGLYVHSGYEFFPRWWYKSWATKWFITASFHDQHHRYFSCNYGGYTTIWDWACGTVRPKFLADFAQLKARVSKQVSPAVGVVGNSPGS
jgi:sterol desaturase/sphingolipid hydroxylase (fatty acid hydroxylase superfamily)